MPTVRVSVESRRGCGFRKPGGLYMIAGRPSTHCGRLPITLECCPTCGGGVKVARGWQWVGDADLLLHNAPCENEDQCLTCPFGGTVKMGRAGMLWVGEKYYATPTAYLREAQELGISRRVKHVPDQFEVDKTWVLLAHRKVLGYDCPACGGRASDGECYKCGGVGKLYFPGVFAAFIPAAVEYVVTGKETEEQLRSLELRGLTLVEVRRKEE